MKFGLNTAIETGRSEYEARHPIIGARKHAVNLQS
jgi:hypothetical protein